MMERKMRPDLSSNIQLSDELREYVDRRLGLALDRFAHRIERVQVRLEDVNGARGGVDKHCRIHVFGRPSWRIQVEGAGESFDDAIDAAAARARRSIGSLLIRLAAQRRKAVA
jgi:ribosome-associated translation inhibitor RaiA